MNTIIENIIKARKGQYCHVLEISEPFELESTLENIVDSFIKEGYKDEDIKDFILTLECHGLSDDANEYIYNFDFNKWAEENII